MFPPQIPPPLVDHSDEPQSTRAPLFEVGVGTKIAIGAFIAFVVVVFAFVLLMATDNSPSNLNSETVNYNPPTQSRAQTSPSPSGMYPCDPASYSKSLLCQARIHMQDPMSEYDGEQATELLKKVPRSAPEYRQAQQMLADVRRRPKIEFQQAPQNNGTSSTPAPVFPEDLIRRKLARDYAEDYVTQKMLYDAEVEAFDYMKSVPESAMKAKVQRGYPTSFVTQKMLYDAQVEAREQMQRRK